MNHVFDELRFPCRKDGKQIYKMLIDGSQKESSSHNTIDVVSPIDSSVLGRVQAATKEDVDLAYNAAVAAQKSWKGFSVYERAEALRRIADDLDRFAVPLGELLVWEVGKKESAAQGEVRRTAEILRCTADEMRAMKGELVFADSFKGFEKVHKVGMVNRVPLGVVLAVSPFNYPINLSASKIAPAIAMGNAVVFKPATQGAISASCMAYLFDRHLPKGVLNLITGKGSEIGDYVVEHDSCSLVAFTGSTNVGKKIAAKAVMKPLLMELGGKDAAIVLEDADLYKAVKEIVLGAFKYAGQRCTAVKRVLVQEKVADDFVDQVLEEAKFFSVGNPHEDVIYGPLISDSAEQFVMELIKDAEEKGAKVLCGGACKEERYLQPTVLDHVTKDMRIAWEEQFAPVLPIIRVKDLDEAVQLTNESEYGLSAALFTKNIAKAMSSAQKLEVGSVHINAMPNRGPDNFPFSCVKDSGIGTQGIRYSLEAMSRIKLTNLYLDR